jgi:pectate lyase
MRRIAVLAVLALVGVPGAALAAQPSHPATPANSHANSHANATSTTGTSSNANTNASSTAGTNGQSASAKGKAAKVLFVLSGTLGAYTAASGTTNGSIAITVETANHESSALKGQKLTFPVSSSTTIVGTVTSGHNGIVKVRAAKNASAAILQTLTAFQVIDQGTTA